MCGGGLAETYLIKLHAAMADSHDTRLVVATADQFIRSRIAAGHTYSAISSQLQHLYPSIRRGLSARSIRRYCSRHDIRSHDHIKVVRLAWADRLRNEIFFFRCVRLHLGLDVVYLVFDYCVRSRLYFR